ncbi:hypothetical protein HPB50_023545 [Hyalomma asiaticum]|uniref:Uncharacterized protein n=1 Tax=Hyalomma asiaticum TaxID=266040 RepID=A0ACB7TQA7_HYAAI|nr:hypothetical protein HPB50_023545 [Hyalomma asiaticum]
MLIVAPQKSRVRRPAGRGTNDRCLRAPVRCLDATPHAGDNDADDEIERLCRRFTAWGDVDNRRKRMTRHQILSPHVRNRYKSRCSRVEHLERTFSDSEFEDSVASYMQSWLPGVPTSSEESFRSMTKEEAYKTTFGYVQYYAVGLEQAVLDQIFHNGPFHRLFLEIQQNLGQLLCELQIGIVHFNVAKNPDVLRDVMSHEYRDMKQDSQRNLRDYIILREYIRLTRYISELFAYLRDHS